MSEIWPPPPKDQPQIAAPPAGLRRLAAVISSGLLYSCLGALMLLFTAFVFVKLSLSKLGFFTEAVLSLSAPVVFSLIFVIVGGSLGYASKHTANGFAALIVSSAAVVLLFGLTLLRAL